MIEPTRLRTAVINSGRDNRTELAESRGLEPLTLAGDCLAGSFLVQPDALRWWRSIAQVWLRRVDSNHDDRLQRPASYR